MKVRHVIVAGMMMVVLAGSNNTTSEFTTVKVKEVEQVGGYT